MVNITEGLNRINSCKYNFFFNGLKIFQQKNGIVIVRNFNPLSIRNNCSWHDQSPYIYTSFFLEKDGTFSYNDHIRDRQVKINLFEYKQKWWNKYWFSFKLNFTFFESTMAYFAKKLYSRLYGV